MSSVARRVNYPSQTVICRAPRADEVAVLLHFSAHASYCWRCGDPYRVLVSGGTLCGIGHAYAWDVARILYYNDGRFFFVGDSNMLISLPKGCDAIRGLFKAIDRGLKIEENTLIISRTKYYVPDRRADVSREYGSVATHNSHYHEDGPQVESSRALVVVKKDQSGVDRKSDEEKQRRRHHHHHRHHHDDTDVVYASRKTTYRR